MKNVKSKNTGFFLLGSGILSWYIFFLVLPVCLILMLSFQSRGDYGETLWTWSADSALSWFNASYFTIFIRSLILAFMTSLLCFVISLLTAWVYATSSRKHARILLGLVVFPFFVNLVVRIYSIKILFGFDQNIFLVMLGMVTTYLPFMALSMMVAMERFDFQWVEAHLDLGGTRWGSLFQIILPNIKPAIASGWLMVFVPSLSEFVIPDMLGGAKNMLVGNLITEQFLKSRNWPLGSSVSIVLLALVSFFSILIHKWGQGRNYE